MNSENEEAKFIKERAERQRREDLLRRGLAAYYQHHPIWQEWQAIRNDGHHPDIHYCRINEHKNVEYVILANMRGPLVVYRVGVRGQLHRLDSYSKDILSLTI